ncbi:MAG: immune inhibitor A, partial [Psychrosphaera sp.]|nr:immune inhibitor A [Psychrosphaera sp.]
MKKRFTLSKICQATVAASFLLSTGAMAEQSFDLNLAQPEQIIKMLVRSGGLNENASQEEQETAYAKYIETKRSSIKNQQPGELAKHKHKLQSAVMQQLLSTEQNDAAHSHSEGELGGVTLERFEGKQRVDHVLAILVEFPDYPHNAVTPGETSNYFDDYTNTHFQDLLFSEKGYVGTDGETHLTMQQFYSQQSGGSYTVDGKTVGWLKAKYPAAHYGNNTNGSARELVREALAAMAKDPDFDLSYFDQE